jgi:hypothetical protein
LAVHQSRIDQPEKNKTDGRADGDIGLKYIAGIEAIRPVRAGAAARGVRLILQTPAGISAIPQLTVSFSFHISSQRCNQ